MSISTMMHPLHLDATTFRMLLELQGPSLGLWRGAEIAALREQTFEHPVLDLGCGDGLVTSMVLAHVEVGVDPNEKALAQARRSGTYQHFAMTPVQQAQLPDACISTVLSNSVLEHIADIDEVLATIARILRPGGRLVFTTPTAVFSRWLALPLRGYAAKRNRQLGHLNLWTVEDWSAHLERAGLEVEYVRPYMSHRLVSFWDALELLQQIWIGRSRLLSIFWRHLPPRFLEYLALWASHIDLAAASQSGGQLIVARKKESSVSYGNR